MKKRDAVGVLLLLTLVCLINIFYDQPRDQSGRRVVRYDCSIAEINPDYPLEVKEKCRRQLEKANNVQN